MTEAPHFPVLDGSSDGEISRNFQLFRFQIHDVDALLKRTTPLGGKEEFTAV
jgi:hypothetical protein